MQANPYRAPTSNLEMPPTATIEPLSDERISETELIAFAGGTRYPSLLFQLLNGKARHAGFNIWAALFGLQWFFFRKLYLFGLLSSVLEFAIPYGIFILVRFLLANKDYALGALIVAAIITRVVIGYMANIALALKAAAVIDEIEKLNKDNETHLRLISHAGGISIPSLLFAYLLLGLLQAYN